MQPQLARLEEEGGFTPDLEQLIADRVDICCRIFLLSQMRFLGALDPYASRALGRKGSESAVALGGALCPEKLGLEMRMLRVTSYGCNAEGVRFWQENDVNEP